MKSRTLVCLALSLAIGAAAPSPAKAQPKTDAAGKPAGEEVKPPEAEPVNPDAPEDPRWVIPTDQLIPATPPRVPSYGAREEWSILPYGYAKLDVMEDSTQSFDSGIGSNLINRVGTYKGDHRRATLTARDSRVGIQVVAPSFPDITPMMKGTRTSGVLEFDFFGLSPSDAKRNDVIVFGPMRIRHAYFKLETFVLDIVAGQTTDLFGWGGYFYPATVAYLGVPGQVYHRSPQLRLERKFRTDDGDFEVMVALGAAAPAQRDSGVPDSQAGIKFAYKGWKGLASSGFGSPYLAPLSLGVSGLYRRFEVPAFRPNAGSASAKTFGWGGTVSLLLPVIPTTALYESGNALTLTGEFSIGTGIADMYSGMDGGSRFPLLANPSLMQPELVYPVNVDPGLVTINRDWNVRSINWRALVAGAQYYLPIESNRIWVSGLYSRIWSDNLKTLTHFTSWGAIFTKMEYIDANISFEFTPAVVMGLSLQTVSQTFADVTAPEPTYMGEPTTIGSVPGTGGKPVTARNNRAQLSMAFFF